MNRVLYILTLLMLLSSCSKVDTPLPNEYGEPIRFSPQVAMASRNLMMSSIYGEEFGVRGYLYDKSSDWETKRSTQKPDANWLNTKVECSNVGVCTYSPIQKWNSAMRYSFFAYYPHTDNGNGDIVLSSANVEDVPVLTYTMRPNAFSEFGKAYDVMIASVVDLTDQYTSYVSLGFNHTLFALNFVVNNLNEASAVIEDFVFEVSDIKYDRIAIPMDGSAPQVSNTQGENISARYDYVTSKITVPSTLNGVMYDISTDKNLLFIPQNGIVGKITITLEGGSPQEIPFNYSGKEFEKGHAYTFSIQIAGSNVTVDLLQESVWNSFDSEIEFD